MSAELLPLLERFQTAIVGVIGFAGVILTLVVNARIARRQERDRREHERAALERALLAELRGSRDAAAYVAKVWGSPGPGAVSVIMAPRRSTPVFDTNITRLGLLSASRLEPVLNAFAHLEYVERTIPLLSEPHGDGEYREVKVGEALEEVVKMERQSVVLLDAAIAALETRGSA